MKKLFSLLVMLLVVISVSACSSNNKADDQLTKIKDAGEIVIGTNSGYPPYEFYDTSNGGKKLVGYDIDLGNAIAKELGVKAKFVDMEFDALIPSLVSGKIDIILAGMINTEDRRKNVDFSDPYFKSVTVVVANKKNINNLQSVEQLKGKKITAQVGTTQADVAKSIEGANVLELPAQGDTIAALTSGKADALFLAEVSAKSIVKKYPDYTYAPIKGVDEDMLFDGASVALNKNQENLKKAINDIIKKLKDSGELDKMFNTNVDLYDKINAK